MKKILDGKKRKRLIVGGKQDGEHIHDKKKRNGGIKTKKQKTKKVNTIGIGKINVASNSSSPQLLDSIFGDTSSNDKSKNNIFGTTASSSLIDSIFDKDNNIATTAKASSTTMSLFDNSRINSNKDRRQWRLKKQEQDKPIKAKTTTEVTNTTSKDDAEAIRRTMRNRKFCSQHRPLLKKALDFPGVFSGEDEKDGFFILDKNERAKETADAVRDYGFCVLRNVMDTDNNNNNDINRDVYGNGDTRHVLRDAVLPAAKDLQLRLNMALKARGIHHSTETFRFREAASRCKGRTDVVFDVLEKDSSMVDVKQSILRNPKIFPVIQNLLGGACSNDNNEDTDGEVKLVYAGLILSYPGSCDQPWHQDGVPLFPELPREQSALLQASLPPYALNVFLPLEDEDGSIEKGPTEFVPGSHKWTAPDERLRLIIEKTNGKEREEESDTDELSDSSDDDTKSGDKAVIAPVLKQGDALIYDYRVCHRGTSNLFGMLDTTKNDPSGIDPGLTPARKKNKEKMKARVSEIDIRGTRRILYLMYARPWFTDHVNFDYTKSAKSVLDDYKTTTSN